MLKQVSLHIICSYVAVSTPDVFVSVSSGPLVAGGVYNVTLTCFAMINASVSDFGTFDNTFMWLNREDTVIQNSQRTNIVSSTRSGSSTLALSPLNVGDTEFTCTVIVTERNNRLATSAIGTGSATINVQGKLVFSCLFPLQSCIFFACSSTLPLILSFCHYCITQSIILVIKLAIFAFLTKPLIYCSAN